MKNPEILSLLREKMPGLLLREGEPMSEHCSFRIGGRAEIFAEPASEETLLQLLSLLRQAGSRPLILGRGTNILFPDEVIHTPIVHPAFQPERMLREGECLIADAGVTLAELAQLARREGLTGLEFAHGIPGSLGGACMMNAGAYGGEMKDVVSRVRCVDENGKIHEYTGAECGFSYRRSRFEESGEIILSARIQLSPGSPEEIGSRMRELMEKRTAGQPLDKPSAGSTFKRPATGYAAAMIDQAGLRGFRVGQAQVSEKHAGFVVNLGGATCRDVRELMEHVQKKVFERFGVLLEPEVRIIKD